MSEKNTHDLEIVWASIRRIQHTLFRTYKSIPNYKNNIYRSFHARIRKTNEKKNCWELSSNRIVWCQLSQQAHVPIIIIVPRKLHEICYSVVKWTPVIIDYSQQNSDNLQNKQQNNSQQIELYKYTAFRIAIKTIA